MSFYIYSITNTQNAWQSKRPEEMVEYINFGFLTVVDAKNPLADAAFMAQIGAKLIRANDSRTYSEYELRNAATGTRFTFEWYYLWGYSFIFFMANFTDNSN